MFQWSFDFELLFTGSVFTKNAGKTAGIIIPYIVLDLSDCYSMNFDITIIFIKTS